MNPTSPRGAATLFDRDHPMTGVPRGVGGRVLVAFRRRPGLPVVLAFAAAVAVGTGLLLLPAARTGPTTSVLEALFTATSAVCVTGLVVVDTATHWSPLGQAIILVLIQVGGFGIMTLASLLSLMISHRLGLRSRLVAAESTRSVGLGDLRTVLTGAAQITVTIEVLTALALTTRFIVGYGETPSRAAWLGLFHSVSAFNNAGFALYSDSLIGFVTDPWVCLPDRRRGDHRRAGLPRPHRGPAPTPPALPLEPAHPDHPAPQRGAPGGRHGVHHARRVVQPGDARAARRAGQAPGGLLPGRHATHRRVQQPRHRCDEQRHVAGHRSADVHRRRKRKHRGRHQGHDLRRPPGRHLVRAARGPGRDPRSRRIAPAAQRQALAVALLSVAAVMTTTIIITLTSAWSLDQALFEAISAFATVGLSTGITADLAPAHQVLIVLLMFIGRLGPVTLGVALALRERQRLFRHPEGAPLIG